jgi:hypothetical protein
MVNLDNELFSERAADGDVGPNLERFTCKRAAI